MGRCQKLNTGKIGCRGVVDECRILSIRVFMKINYKTRIKMQNVLTNKKPQGRKKFVSCISYL